MFHYECHCEISFIFEKETARHPRTLFLARELFFFRGRRQWPQASQSADPEGGPAWGEVFFCVRGGLGVKRYLETGPPGPPWVLEKLTKTLCFE